MTFSAYRCLLVLFGFTSLLVLACEDDDDPGCIDCGVEVIEGEYNPTPYTLVFPDHLGVPIIPADNPLTEEGVLLGRMLFYDPILSADSSMSCVNCHFPQRAFTDGLTKSVGIQGIETSRNAMALVNLVFLDSVFFWDGAAFTLEDQALLPIEAHDELNDNWENVEDKLRKHPDYPQRFRAAFGIDVKSEITSDLAVKAIAQFERTLISGNSKYDQVVWRNEGRFTEEELFGEQLFKVETAITLEHPGCTHCHNGENFTNSQFMNNGLDDPGGSYEGFVDKGRGGVTGVIFDNGKFRVPTLRNIALTAPYMHDGRFATLGEVLDHYASGGHGAEFSDVNIRPFELTDEEKQALLAYLNTLTDTTFTNNPAFQNPF